MFTSRSPHLVASAIALPDIDVVPVASVVRSHGVQAVGFIGGEKFLPVSGEIPKLIVLVVAFPELDVVPVPDARVPGVQAKSVGLVNIESIYALPVPLLVFSPVALPELDVVSVGPVARRHRIQAQFMGTVLNFQ
jgi:hypothetical protein